MGGRLKLHEELCNILGTRNVYYNPPASVRMDYPCIVYSKLKPDLKRANNKIYASKDQYELTVIDKNPDSDIPDKLLNHFSMCSWDQEYPADNLNHTKLSLYY